MKKHTKMIFLALALIALALVYPIGRAITLTAQGEYSVSVECDGSPAGSLILENGDKKQLRAVGMPRGTEYTWQMLIPETLIWTDISGADSAECDVSSALIRGSLDIGGRAAIRCRVRYGGETYVSDPVTVALAPEKEEQETVISSGPRPVYAPVRRAAAAAAAEKEYVTITIEYRHGDESGEKVFNDYVVTLNNGGSFNASVPSPERIGYLPYIKINGTEMEAKTVSLQYNGLDTDVNITVYYKPAMSPYRVRYFLQNVSDDGYTEDVSLSYTGEALTGTYPDESIEKDIAGFTPLFHVPDTVAADGSTEFNIYYDRNYYLYQFDCDGGYGTEPVYARYGTPLVVPQPTKPGYTFGGWGNAAATGGVTPETLPTAIGDGNRSFKAIWKSNPAKYTVVYWLENPDDNGYSFWTMEEIEKDSSGNTVMSGDKISYDDIVGVDKEPAYPSETAGMDIFNCIYNDEQTRKEWDLDDGDQNGNPDDFVVSGDGSTLINLYYSRRKYTLRFIYGREIGNTFYVPGGSTYAFGRNGNIDAQPDTNNNDVSQYLGNVGNWGAVAKPDIAANLKNFSEEVQKSYTFSSFGNGTNSSPRYYYFDITRKYGALLNDVWPATLKMGNTPIAYQGSNNGNYAVFSAWNGENYVAYNAANTNETIKGRYLRLDDEIIYERQYNDKYNTDGNGNAVVNYLAFWENGAPNVGWNKAVKWNYEIYQEPLPVEEMEFLRDYPEQAAAIKAYAEKLKGAGEGVSGENNIVSSLQPYSDAGQMTFKDDSGRVWIYFNGDDWYHSTDVDSGIKKGTAGYYYLYGETYVSSDDNRIVHADRPNDYVLSSQTPPGAAGNTLAYGQVFATELIGNDKDIYNGDHEYTARFFFDRDHKTLTLNNNGTWLSEAYGGRGYQVQTGRILEIVLNGILNYGLKDEKEIDAFPTGDQKPRPDKFPEGLAPPYPENLEKDAYYFEAWYTTPNFIEGTQMLQDYLMPARDAALYARWLPISHDVTFSYSYTDMKSGIYVDGKTLSVKHQDIIYTQDIPDSSGWDGISGDKKNYEFVGWFYEDENGVKRSFDPETMPVISDMHLFAEWRSASIVEYTVRYVDTDGNRIADDLTGYAYAGTTKTFTAKTGGELGEGFREGYFPQTSSHSIIAGEEQEYTFVYKHIPEGVGYTVRYLERGTEKELHAPKKGHSTSAVITERFELISDYISDAFYKTMILSSDENQNVITFWYTENKSDAFYAVEYLTEDLDGNGYTLYSRVEMVGKIGDDISADIIGITGFDYSRTKAEIDSKDAEVKVSADKTSVSAKLDKGLVIRIYYNRNDYNYSVEYLEYGGEHQMLEKPVNNVPARYGSTVAHEASDRLEVNGRKYIRVGEAQQSRVITDNNDQKMIFYYQLQTVTITYIPRSLYPGAVGGTVTPGSETVSGTVTGSTAEPDKNYRFVGWYFDSQCVYPVPEEWVTDTYKITPGELYYGDAGEQPYQNNIYYALFEPVTDDLVITKVVSTGTDQTDGSEAGSASAADDTFIFSVVGTPGTAGANIDLTVTLRGEGSVTVKALPLGEYTVTELTDWSWRYDTESGSVKTAVVTDSSDGSAPAEVVFVNKPNGSTWLGGETSNENKFSGKSN